MEATSHAPMIEQQMIERQVTEQQVIERQVIDVMEQGVLAWSVDGRCLLFNARVHAMLEIDGTFLAPDTPAPNSAAGRWRVVKSARLILTMSNG